jgi:catechol 2,3-dioxygenase-like lactoylglutathione lyase family enzyme
MPEISGVLETALYVADIERSAQFYRALFGFEPMVQDQRFCAMNVAGRQVLLLFRRGSSAGALEVPGGLIPGHDGSGTTHLAFAIARSELDPWRERLAARGVALESTVHWPQGGVSLYFRDPDEHLLELVTPGLWPIY